jgi:two-component system nitrate/nitrite response regulator NarL
MNNSAIFEKKTLDAASASVSVLVVDDHIILGDTLAQTLEVVANFDVKPVSSVDGALAAIEEHGRFDVILLDYYLPNIDTFSVIKKLVKLNSGGVVLFSGVTKFGLIDRACDLGIVGFIPKTMHLSTLRHAIAVIASGSPFFPIEYLRRRKSDVELAFDFRPIEKSLILRLSKGLTNKEIGLELDLSEINVKMHMRALFSKLGVKNRTQAALRARDLGFDK